MQLLILWQASPPGPHLSLNNEAIRHQKGWRTLGHHPAPPPTGPLKIWADILGVKPLREDPDVTCSKSTIASVPNPVWAHDSWNPVKPCPTVVPHP